MDFINYLRDFNIVTALIRIVLAGVLGGMIGMERSRHGRNAGFRTHILVCMGSSLTILCGLFAAETLGYATDPLRIGAQVVSGIGFLGAGTILIRSQSVITGLTTAAGLWSTSAIGLACGIGFYEGAIVCGIGSLIVMSVLNRLEKSKRVDDEFYVYIELSSSDVLNSVLDSLSADKMELRNLEILSPVSGINGHVGIIGALSNEFGKHPEETINRIISRESVSFAIERDSAFTK